MGERVWDRFLTEQDKATLTGKAPIFTVGSSAIGRALSLTPSKPGRGVAARRGGTRCHIFKSCWPKRVRWKFP